MKVIKDKIAQVFKNKAFQLLFFTLFPLVLSAIVYAFCRSKHFPWYYEIKRPSWNAPRWAFPVVWNPLYVIMGYSSYRVYDEGEGFSGYARYPLISYFIQLFINLTWMPIFFYYHQLGLASIYIFLLWIAIIFMIFFFRMIDKTAAYLNIPYLCWVSYATVLTFTIWTMN